MIREDLPGLIGAAYKIVLTVHNLMRAVRKPGIAPFNPDIFQRPRETTVIGKPKSRTERANVRSIKLLLTDIGQNVESPLNKALERKKNYVIPTCGAAIIENEFLEKLKEPKNENDNAKDVKSMPKMKKQGKEEKSSKSTKI